METRVSGWKSEGEWSAQWFKGRFSMRARATCVPFPSSFKPLQKGCHYTVIGWDRNAPSCFHSSIRSQAPHLCTGDLNPLQLVMRENQHKLRNTASQIIGLLQYKRRKSWGAHGGTVTNTSWASFRAHFSSCLFFAKFENKNKNLQHQTCQTTSVFYHELSPHLVFNPFSCG